MVCAPTGAHLRGTRAGRRSGAPRCCAFECGPALVRHEQGAEGITAWRKVGTDAGEVAEYLELVD